MEEPVAGRERQPIRVLLADDHLVVRKGLRSLLDAHTDIAVIGEAEDGFEALRLTKSLQPDVLLLDLSMPRLGGIEVVRELRHSQPETRIVVLSMLPVESSGCRELESGITAYVLKGGPAAEIPAAIRAALRTTRSELVLSPDALWKERPVHAAPYRLSDRIAGPTLSG